MEKLYKNLIDEGRLFDAYIVLKNSLSKTPDSEEIFIDFVELAIRIASLDIEISTRKKYLGEADMAITLFSESAEMKDIAEVEIVKKYSSSVAKCFNELVASEKEIQAKKTEEKRKSNQHFFSELSNIYKEMEKTEKQEEFDSLLESISQCEKSIDKNAFNKAQSESYDTITQGFSKLISDKVEELNHKKLINYNKEALKNFKEVFDRYSNKKAFYNKNENDLKSLVTQYLFVYDSRDLFNESLIYYNHVYSTIFNGVGDDLKYKMTEWSILTPKLKRN